MVLKTYKAVVLAATAALVIAGCGKQDITDLQDTWTKKEGEVIAKLTDVKNKNQELHAKFGTVQAANIVDSSKIADRAKAEATLNGEDTQIGDIEKTIADLKTKRDSATTAGKRAEYQTAWTSAEADYNTAMTKLSALDQQNGELTAMLDGLSKAAAAPMMVDTTAMNGAPSTPDTAMAAPSTKKMETMPTQAEKIDSAKANGKMTAKKPAEAEKTIKSEKTNSSK